MVPPCRTPKRATATLVNEVMNKTPNESEVVLLGYLNCRSVCNKALELCDLIADGEFDLCVLTETWLKGDIRDEPIIAELKPNGYKIHHISRCKTRGGGVALLYKDTLNVTMNRRSTWSSFEYMECSVATSSPLRLVVIYRPPHHDFNAFVRNFTEYLELLVITRSELLLIGDFNIHLDDASNKEGREFSQLLDTFGLSQHVKQPTHVAGHLLDCVITKSRNAMRPSVSVIDQCVSDHSTILCHLTLAKPQAQTQSISYRSFKRIDLCALKTDIASSFATDTSAMHQCPLSHYNSTIRSIVDRHAPLKHKVVPVRKNAEWYNDRIRLSKQTRRQKERTWRKSGLITHKEDFIDAKRDVNSLISQAKTDYYARLITDHHDNPKRMFAVVSQLLGKEKTCAMPPDRSDADLVMDFSNYFIDKINNIRSTIPPSHSNPISRTVSSILHSFQDASQDEIKRIIMKAPTKHCSLDPMPTHLLKDCIDSLLPSITRVINQSLRSGVVPSDFKKAIVKPLIKKPSLDPSLLSNYRPVSNLPFLSKILEKVVLAQFNSHLTTNNLHNRLQSAYRPHHSTETALLKLQSDLLSSMAEKRASMVVLLDLSAAFDLVEHEMQLYTLEHEFGVQGVVLDWFKSYLSGRMQRVSIGENLSDSVELLSGVPQGSVLGPVLFTVYTASLASLLDSHHVQYHFYADDTSIYVSFNPGDVDTAFTQMKRCIDDVRFWMAAKKLKMNDSKSNFIIVASKSVLNNESFNRTFNVGDVALVPEQSVKNLGVILDQSLSMEDNINATCRTAYYHLCNIGRIRKFLSYQSCEQLIHAFITSRIDYCNSLYFNLPNRLLNKLQSVQNCAARILTFTKRFEHITPVLKALHWLPVAFRIRFKILLLVYKCINGMAPVYLQELLSLYVPGRDLRSNDHLLLAQPFSYHSYFHRCFQSCGPILWNTLPLSIKMSSSLSGFKRKLKTHLFIQAFN